jgi:hypothetical protein
VPPAAGVMLKQKEITFLQAFSSVKPSPALLRELRKAIAMKKGKKAAACSKAHSSYRKASQPIASKRKADELSRPEWPDGSSQQAPSARSASRVNDARHFGRTDCREQPAT